MGTLNPAAFPQPDRTNQTQRRNVTYTGPTSYATGGDSMPPESVGLGKIHAILGLTISDGTNVYFGYYNKTTEMILWYSATATEIANGTDLSTFTGSFEVIGL